MLSTLFLQHGRESLDHPVPAAHDMALVRRYACVGSAESRGQSDATRDRIQFRNHHAVRRRDHVGTDDGGKMIPESFHPAVCDQPFRLPLIEICGNPCRLDSACTLHIEPVQGPIEEEELRPQGLKERQLVRCERQGLCADAPGGLNGLLPRR